MPHVSPFLQDVGIVVSIDRNRKLEVAMSRKFGETWGIRKNSF